MAKKISISTLEGTTFKEVVRDMTAVEETQVEQDIASEVSQRAILDQKATDKANGKQKLKDLGLNDDEIKALTGA
jgi:hypothetical protein